MISADLVPESVRASLDRKSISDLVWHVSQGNWQDVGSLYAATYLFTAPDGSRQRMAYVEGVGPASRFDGTSLGLGVDHDQVSTG